MARRYGRVVSPWQKDEIPEGTHARRELDRGNWVRIVGDLLVEVWDEAGRIIYTLSWPPAGEDG